MVAALSVRVRVQPVRIHDIDEIPDRLVEKIDFAGLRGGDPGRGSVP